MIEHPRPPGYAAAMILVVGSANIDFVTPVEHIPAPGETVLGSGYTVAPGGKGANQAVACGRAGGKVAFVGALGRDPFAELLRESLRESGVEDRTLELDAPTGAAFISVSAAGENAITVASGANGALTPKLLPAFGEMSHLVMQLELPLPTVLEAARRARAAGARVVLNASPARALPPELLRLTDVLVVNEGELSALAGEGGSPAELGARLEAARRLGPDTVIVTLGERGSLALSGEGLTTVSAQRVAVLDTTGAGDTYLGVLVAALAAGERLPAAMRRASVASALACTKAGAQPSMPWWGEIEAAL